MPIQFWLIVKTAMPNIYTYVDYTGFLAEVTESDLNFAGDWRSTANYYRYDVVNYGFARYVCTTANTNQAPPSDLQFNGYWSIITFTSTGTGSSGTNAGGGASVQMVQDVYSLAYRAYNIALTGTDLPIPGAVDSWVTEWIGHTYNIARTGTVAAAAAQSSANAADMWGRTAYHLGVAGTNAANSADMWGRDAFSLAVAGTNAAAAAQAAANSADMWGRDAFSLAVAGTNAANSADAWGRAAYSLAVSGTTTAAAAQAAADSAWSYAGQAWDIAVAGTNSADQAYSLALQALYTAWTGTDTGGGGSGTVPQWVMEWIGHTYNLALYGTSAANAAQGMALAAQLDAYAAWQYAGQAWGIAVAGTNAANQAYSLAMQALQMAWTGTDTPTPGPGGGSGTVPSWVMDWLAQTYSLSVTGTNAVDQTDMTARLAWNLAQAGTTAANSADSWGRDAFGLAVTGTTAAAAAQATATQALNLATTLSTIQNFGRPGTLTAFVGQVPGWKTDIELTIRDGIVTDVGNSRYSIELFNSYANGPVGTIAGDLGGGNLWDGTGRILAWNCPYPDPSFDPKEARVGFGAGAYSDFVVSGTFGVDIFQIGGGSGWEAPWIVWQEGYRCMGTESFESFNTGVVYGTNFTEAIGYGWSGTVAFV